MSDMNDGFHNAVRPQSALQGMPTAATEAPPCDGPNQNNPRSAGLDNEGPMSWTHFRGEVPGPNRPNSNPVG